MTDKAKVKLYRERKKKLWSERSGNNWDSHWQELSNYIHPRALRLHASRRNKGTKQTSFIKNSTATFASRILSSGMHAGNTPPSRPWFRLGAFDPQQRTEHGVRDYLGNVRDILLEMFARTNVYNAFPRIYRHLGDFGTACMLVLEDEQDIFRCHVLSPGTYALSQDSQMRVDTLYRTVQLTARQIEQQWPERGSQPVQDAIKNNRLDEIFEVVNCIEPNEEANPALFEPGGMPWRSVWFEEKSTEESILGEGGFRSKPFMAPRWEVEGEDSYGNCPGMEALPDIKSLQHLERRKAQLMDKLVNPPMQGPGSLRSEVAGLLPGMITYLDSATGQKFEPAFVPDARGLQIQNDMERYEFRINRAYFADLFLMLANTAISGMTAREVEERHEEKMLQLGPVLERINDELLDPFIDRTFDIGNNRGLLPDPPKELEGQQTKIEYLSILAQAQKLVAT
ncbi:MAG TPA: portal protein, partial [Polyangia bacterium]|nr:portal protein [Polyangia bacterium]